MSLLIDQLITGGIRFVNKTKHSAKSSETRALTFAINYAVGEEGK